MRLEPDTWNLKPVLAMQSPIKNKEGLRQCAKLQDFGGAVIVIVVIVVPGQ